MPKPPVEQERLLVITLSNIGDLVLTTPIFEALSQRFAGYPIDIVGDRRSIELLAHASYVGEIFIFQKRGGWRAHLALLRQLRRRRYAAVVDLRTAYIPYLLRAALRLHKPTRRTPGLHAVREHYSALAAIEPAPSPPECRLYLPAASVDAARSLLTALPGRLWLALAPGANWPGKQWPREHFRTLLTHAASRFDGVIILGSAADERDAAALSETTLPVLNVAGRTDLCTAAALIAQARAFLGNDSGLGHIAAAMQVPTLTLFGPGDPARYRPWGKQAQIACAPDQDLSRLLPSTVFAVLEQLLADT